MYFEYLRRINKKRIVAAGVLGLMLYVFYFMSRFRGNDENSLATEGVIIGANEVDIWAKQSISVKATNTKFKTLADCQLSKDLGPIWSRSKFKNFESWQRCIKNDADLKFKESFKLHSTKGGAWKPKNCVARHSVAIIIPFRDREEHLNLFLKILHPFLQRQQLDYQIFVFEQFGDKKKPFNKGKLFNVGFLTVKSMRPDIRCFVFHDVDLVPEDERMLYRCDDSAAIHLAAIVDTLEYTPSHISCVGGVIAVTKEQYLTINGFSNLYWGWGGEDDDFGWRLIEAGIPIKRDSAKQPFHRYTMLKHVSRNTKANPKRHKLLGWAREMFPTEGLNSLFKRGFSVEKTVESEDFVWVVVDVKEEK